MLRKNLKRAVSDIGGFFGILSADKFVKVLTSKEKKGFPSPLTKSTETKETTTYRFLESLSDGIPLVEALKIFVDSETGKLSYPDIVVTPSSIQNLDAEKMPLNPSRAKPVYGYSQGRGLSASGNKIYTTQDLKIDNAGKSSVPIHVIQVFSPLMSIASQDTDAVALFLNSIPTLEMSRCVPFIDLTIMGTDIEASPGNTPDISLSRFLLGPSSANESSLSKSLIAGVDTESLGTVTTTKRNDDNSRTKNEHKVNKILAGMEIFTTPQTMIGHAGNAIETPGRDKFRPLMSLQDFTVTCVGAGGMMSARHATLKLMLHDRTRLGDIAPLIRPGGYGNMRLIIEYGWSHPDSGNVGRKSDSDFNRFADLLGAMRTREIYGVSNSSMSFEDDGQVSISLDLYLYGFNASTNFSLSDAKMVTQAELDQTVVEAVQKYITNNIQNSQKSKLARIDIPQEIKSAASAGSFLNIDKDEISKIKEFVKKESKNKDVEEMRKQISQLFSAKNNAVNDIKKSAVAAATKRVENLQKTCDPFYENFSKLSIQNSDTADDSGIFDSKNPKRIKHVSLGKIITSLVAESIANTEKFSEVQVLFYSFNDEAGGMHEANIAQFPVNLNDFQNVFSDYFSKTGKMTMLDVLKLLNDYILKDQASDAYGFSSLYEADKEAGSKGEHKKKIKKEYEKNQTNLESVENKILKNIYGDSIADPGFKMPQITIRFEVIPVSNFSSGSTEKGSSIARIHVVDQQTTVFETAKQIFNAMSQLGVVSLGTPSQVIESAEKKRRIAGHKSIRNSQFEFLTALKVLEPLNYKGDISKAAEINKYNLYTVKSDITSLKDTFSTLFPTIIYGGLSAGMKNVKIQTQQDSALSTVNILRQSRGEGIESPGLPISVLPTELTMECFGCPYIGFAQQYFVDMGTGTTADNFYSVTGITHTLKEGEFNTSVSMIQTDGFGRYKSHKTSAIAAEAYLQKIHGDAQNVESDNKKFAGKKPGTASKATKK